MLAKITNKSSQTFLLILINAAVAASFVVPKQIFPSTSTGSRPFPCPRRNMFSLPTTPKSTSRWLKFGKENKEDHDNNEVDNNDFGKGIESSSFLESHHRRTFLSALFLPLPLSLSLASSALAEEATTNESSDFASIAKRASKLTNTLVTTESEKFELELQQQANAASAARDNRRCYDFTLPVNGRDVPFGQLVRQEFLVELKLPTPGSSGADATVRSANAATAEAAIALAKADADAFREAESQAATSVSADSDGNSTKIEVKDVDENKYAKSKVKAIIVVNLKQDDPFSRRNIPGLMSLAAKYRNGEVVVIASPTDQGYYEADTSQLIRLKLSSEYGLGLNPATIVTDKVNLLGTGAHPFWRWLEGSCRSPDGRGAVQANYEKFLIDGRTGRPVRRYPRKFDALDMLEDVEALVAGNKLPVSPKGWREQWREAEKDALTDTYRFQKGLNVFDQ